MRTGGAMTKFCEGYNLVDTIFREFFDFFWTSTETFDISTLSLPTTNEEINHVENLCSLIGYPGFVGSIDYVHVPWGRVHGN
jgi:hypothetical protein